MAEPSKFVPRDQVVAAFRTAATFDADQFRRDLDEAIDQDAVIAREQPDGSRGYEKRSR